jgi:hypothetical protein
MGMMPLPGIPPMDAFLLDAAAYLSTLDHRYQMAANNKWQATRGFTTVQESCNLLPYQIIADGRTMSAICHIIDPPF